MKNIYNERLKARKLQILVYIIRAPELFSFRVLLLVLGTILICKRDSCLFQIGKPTLST